MTHEKFTNRSSPVYATQTPIVNENISDGDQDHNSGKLPLEPFTWGHHEDRPESEDQMTDDFLFEAILDQTYGHFNVRRTEWELTAHEHATLTDDLIAQVRNLKDATPLLRTYLAERAAQADETSPKKEIPCSTN
jgi:hypothetical protein